MYSVELWRGSGHELPTPPPSTILPISWWGRSSRRGVPRGDICNPSTYDPLVRRLCRFLWTFLRAEVFFPLPSWSALGPYLCLNLPYLCYSRPLVSVCCRVGSVCPLISNLRRGSQTVPIVVRGRFSKIPLALPLSRVMSAGSGLVLEYVPFLVLSHRSFSVGFCSVSDFLFDARQT